MSDCQVCGTPEYDKPMCFKGEQWCSDDCRKLILGEINEVTFTILTGRVKDEKTGLFTMRLDQARRAKEKRREQNRRNQAALGK